MPLQILVLDDCRFERARVRRLCSQSGLSVELTEIQTVSEMEAALTEVSFDVIILDYRLPGESGLEALKLLRNSGESAGIIMMTESFNPSVKDCATVLGCDLFWRKECITPQSLSEAISNLQKVKMERQQNSRGLINFNFPH
ncbi:MAG: response regulator [Roseobacter sp.]